MHHAFSKLFAVVFPAIKWKRGEAGAGKWKIGKCLLGSRLQNAFIRKFMYLTGDDDADEQNDDADVKGHRSCGDVDAGSWDGIHWMLMSKKATKASAKGQKWTQTDRQPAENENENETEDAHEDVPKDEHEDED
ncbi:GM14374 [Drosophila sechellia]|uniref:GM14374 n=1 Tax=Drosophila sechellia TaxID=7238 RepID=B4HVM7_DROSE|nr:GM14374 [Drosophila sechellia]